MYLFIIKVRDMQKKFKFLLHIYIYIYMAALPVNDNLVLCASLQDVFSTISSLTIIFIGSH